MTVSTTSYRAFRDELSKIAGELQGFTRIGRKPISIERLLEREAEMTGLPEDFAKMAKAGSTGAKALIGLGLAGGAGGYHYGRKAEMDRRTGRAMRLQAQMQQGY